MPNEPQKINFSLEHFNHYINIYQLLTGKQPTYIPVNQEAFDWFKKAQIDSSKILGVEVKETRPSYRGIKVKLKTDIK